jgi:glycosyltransferase involved in cell wall biosynthesis
VPVQREEETVVRRDESESMDGWCSVVVPAHDEGGVLADRLGSLVRDLPAGVAEVIVVANGCTDDTVAVARSLPGVDVVAVPDASKTVALNAGDGRATRFPRVYLDADVRLSPQALTALVRELRTEEPVVAAPRVRFDVDGCSWVVRAFFAVFRRLPYTRQGLVGLGVYGMSESARGRFGAFPDVVADDLYVQRLFSEEERVVVDATFEVVAPRTVRGLLQVRTRVARGNQELAARAADLGIESGSTSAGTARALAGEVVRTPALLPAALVYLAVTAIARARARRAGTGTVWERDESSRAGRPGTELTVVAGGDR